MSPPFKITEYHDLHFISQATSPNFLSWTRGVVASWVRSLPCRTRKVGRNTFSAGKVGRWLVSWSDEAEETLLFVSLYFFGKSSSSSSTVPAFFYVKWSPVADSENSERRAGRFFSHLFIYSRFPITRSFKGNRKSLSYREFKSRITGNNKEISNEWGGNAIKQQSIQGWTLNLNWSDKNNKDKELTRLF